MGRARRRVVGDLLLEDIAGISMSTGRGRPLRTWVKARRITSGMVEPRVTCSIHLVTCWKLRNELKLGAVW